MKKKWILRMIFGVLIAVVVVIVGSLMWIDRIARTAVETGGTYALGVTTTLSDMDIGLMSGRVKMSGLNVTNPDGFETPHFFRLDTGHLAVSVRSLMKEKVIVPELTLEGISMNLERKGERANYNVILDHLKTFESDHKAEPPHDRPKEQERTQKKKFVIEKLTIRQIDVQVDLLPIDGKHTRVPIEIDEIILDNIGSDSDQGVLIAQLTDIVIKGILEAVLKQTTDLPADIVAELGSGLDQLSGVADYLADDVVKEIDEAVQKLDQAGQEIGQELEKQLDEVGKKLGEDLDDF